MSKSRSARFPISIEKVTACVKAGRTPGAADVAATSTWAEYRDSKYGFGFKYPPGWRVRAGSANGSAVINISRDAAEGEPPGLMTIAVQENQNAKGLPIERWFAEKRKQQKVSPQTSGTLTIGGQNAVFMENTNAFGVRRDVFLPLRSTDILSVGYVRDPSHDQTYSDVLKSIRLTTADR